MGKNRFIQIVIESSKAFALCAGTEEAIAIRDESRILSSRQSGARETARRGGRIISRS